MIRTTRDHTGRAFLLSAITTISLLFSTMLLAEDMSTLKEDIGHVARWNRFTDDLYKLHKSRIERRAVRTEKSIGGYATYPDFYHQVDYYDKERNLLLSSIQWERNNPKNIHAISIFIYDTVGRLKRDYDSTYLPHYRNAPTQTLASVYGYNEGVKAFRSYDASGEFIYERCEGQFDGEPVFISLDIDELEEAMGERYQHKRGILTEPAYRHCFGHMPEDADSLFPPE